MRKIMIFQHVGHEPLGTLNPLLKALGFRIRYINFARHPGLQPSLEGYNGLVILGGPMSVYEFDKHPHLAVELKLIEQALKMEIPVLGICLGAQLIAAALGAQVRRAKHPEIGWHHLHLTNQGFKDPFFAGYTAEEKVFELHQDIFNVPSTAVHLASTRNHPDQAFRYGKKVYGLQFHLEADRATILRWLGRPENLEMMKHVPGGLTHAQIIADTEAHIPRSLGLSRDSFLKFTDIFQLPERPVRLGSTR